MAACADADGSLSAVWHQAGYAPGLKRRARDGGTVAAGNQPEEVAGVAAHENCPHRSNYRIDSPRRKVYFLFPTTR